MSDTITTEELEHFKFKTTHVRGGDLTQAEQMRLVHAYGVLLARNENLSQHYRVAVNTSEQAAIPLAKVRELNTQHEAGLVADDQFLAGVKFWVTN